MKKLILILCAGVLIVSCKHGVLVTYEGAEDGKGNLLIYKIYHYDKNYNFKTLFRTLKEPCTDSAFREAITGLKNEKN